MKLPDSLLDEIKEKVSLQDVVSDYVNLQKKGSRLWGLCPFHTEKTPSFSIDEQKGLYFCYGCKKGGSVYNFLMEIEQLSFIEAVKLLADRAGVVLPEQTTEDSASYDEKAKEQKLLYELYHRLRESFHHILVNHDQGKEAMEYLSRRGISEDMVRKFQLGFIPSSRRWLYQFLTKRNYSPDFLKKTGLFSSKYPELSMFSGRLVFPISDRRGRVVAFGGRAMEDTSYAKYVNSPETVIFHKRKTLFGLHESKEGLRTSGQAILCEGYFDVLALHQLGFPHAVAPLGTACTQEQAAEIKRFANEVHLMFDQDQSGIDAMLSTLPIMEAIDIDGKIIIMPKGKDPADLLLEDPELLKKSVKNPINGFEYLVKTLAERYDIYSPEGKRSIFQQTFPLIASTTSEIKRDEYLRTVADIMQLDVIVLYDDYRNMFRSAEKKKPGEGRRTEEGQSRKRVITRDLEMYIIITLFAHEKLFARFRNEIDSDEIKNPVARELYLVLENSFRKGITDVDLLLEEVTDSQIKSFLIQELESGTYTTHPEKIIEDGIQRIKLRQLTERQRFVVRSMKELEKRQDTGSLEKLKDLMYEKKFLDEEIQEKRKKI